MFHSLSFTGEGFKVGKLHIGNNIRKLRFEHNEMTQQQLAEKVGVTRQTIVAIESAKYSPSLELAFNIALAFDVPLEAVFFVENNDP
jgi:putative transcriptional regulator